MLVCQSVDGAPSVMFLNLQLRGFPELDQVCFLNFAHVGSLLTSIALYCSCLILDLPETNTDPENRPSQNEIHLPTIDFQGLC